jgi:hypothetical protein
VELSGSGAMHRKRGHIDLFCHLSLVRPWSCNSRICCVEPDERGAPGLGQNPWLWGFLQSFRTAQSVESRRHGRVFHDLGESLCLTLDLRIFVGSLLSADEATSRWTYWPLRWLNRRVGLQPDPLPEVAVRSRTRYTACVTFSVAASQSNADQCRPNASPRRSPNASITVSNGSSRAPRT